MHRVIRDLTSRQRRRQWKRHRKMDYVPRSTTELPWRLHGRSPSNGGSIWWVPATWSTNAAKRFLSCVYLCACLIDTLNSFEISKGRVNVDSLTYLKGLSVGPGGVWTSHLPLSRPVAGALPTELTRWRYTRSCTYSPPGWKQAIQPSSSIYTLAGEMYFAPSVRCGVSEGEGGRGLLLCVNRIGMYRPKGYGFWCGVSTGSPSALFVGSGVRGHLVGIY